MDFTVKEQLYGRCNVKTREPVYRRKPEGGGSSDGRKGVAIEEGKINVTMPVEVLSADEYAALPEEENRSETLYGVPEPPWTPMPESLSVQDYNTEDGWHVRNWK